MVATSGLRRMLQGSKSRGSLTLKRPCLHVAVGAEMSTSKVDSLGLQISRDFCVNKRLLKMRTLSAELVAASKKEPADAVADKNAPPDMS